jgi:hypothetical protein
MTDPINLEEFRSSSGHCFELQRPVSCPHAGNHPRWFESGTLEAGFRFVVALYDADGVFIPVGRSAEIARADLFEYEQSPNYRSGTVSTLHRDPATCHTVQMLLKHSLPVKSGSPSGFGLQNARSAIQANAPDLFDSPDFYEMLIAKLVDGGLVSPVQVGLAARILAKNLKDNEGDRESAFNGMMRRQGFDPV